MTAVCKALFFATNKMRKNKVNTKTPYNPSKSAIKRVKNALPIPTDCNCCHDFETGEFTTDCVEIIENKEIYGKNYGEWPWAYRCTNCEAYVGMHPFTNIPLGTLADAPTRQARKKCKEPFEALHKKGKMTRSEAYKALAEKLEIKTEDCHFGWFDVDMCNKAASAAREIYLGL
jgi:hypothetical protein